MKYTVLLLSIFMAFFSHAQIGYQVSLLDVKTGEPRTNEKVSVSVKITDSEGVVICDVQQSVTSDAFGVLSLTIGNENTFSNVNWQNLPLKISATVDGILIGSCNILNVPVAEYSKRTGVLTSQILAGKSVSMYDDGHMTFTGSGTATYTSSYDGTQTYAYEIDGNNVYVFRTSHSCWTFFYNPKTGKLYMTDD